MGGIIAGNKGNFLEINADGSIKLAEDFVTKVNGLSTEAKQDALATLVGALNSTAETDPTAAANQIALLKGLIKQLQGDGDKANAFQLTGSMVEEVLTEAGATGGPPADTLTFSANINSIEIWHDEATPQEFIVNGITLIIASGGWRSPIGGTPSSEVTIPDISCTVSRLV